ncbi:MAG: DUF4328 domain-containing protein [Phycisphaerales bacterium]|nr:DUF4328 domain-containing protein [Phycisphaerales bacterium]
MFQILANTSGQAAAESAVAVGFMAALGAAACYLAIVVGVLVVVIWLIYDAAKAADPKHRNMEPGLVWLLIIPIFNVFWNFRALPAVADSLAATLRDHGKDEGDCGRFFGYIWSLLMIAWWILLIVGIAGGNAMAFAGGNAASVSVAALGLIGILKLIADLAILVCVILYIVKVQTAKSKIRSAGKAPVSPG